MPKKNVEPKDELTTEEEAALFNESLSNEDFEAREKAKREQGAQPEKPAKSGGCGHVNRQAYGTNGKLQELVCDLEPKHKGDHHARAIRNVPEPVTDQKGITTSVKQREEEADAWWGDAAGKLTRDIIADVPEQMSLFQKDLVMGILNKNPNLTVEQALSQAKASPAWSAASAPS